MAQFRVVLDQVELGDKQHAELDRALQKTTLQFLAGIDNRGDSIAYYAPRVFRPPLAGIWIRRIDDEGLLKRFNEEVGIGDSVRELNAELEKGVEF